MTYCPQCGYALGEEDKKCPACGTPAFQPTKQTKTLFEAVKAAEAPKARAELPSEQDKAAEIPEKKSFPIPEPVKEGKRKAVKTAYGDNIIPTGKYAVVSLGGYFWNLLLFCLPVIGLIAAAVTAMATRNQNKKRLAVAMVILQSVFIAVAAGAWAVNTYVYDFVSVISELF